MRIKRVLICFLNSFDPDQVCNMFANYQINTWFSKQLKNDLEKALKSLSFSKKYYSSFLAESIVSKESHLRSK